MSRKREYASRTGLRIAVSTLTVALISMLGTVVGASPAAAQGPLVAVLPNATGQCPAGAGSWWIQQDNEDSSNKNNRYGWIGGIASTNNTRYTLCAVDGDRFRSLLSYQVSFAVLALGQTCPTGAVTFDRYFDDEDSDNKSSHSVPAGSATRTSGGGTTFRFCWFLNYRPEAPPAPTAAFPDLGGVYGGFGPPGQSFVLDSGWVRTDDEDGSNNNSVSPLDPTLTHYRGLWLSADSNTRMDIVRVR